MGMLGLGESLFFCWKVVCMGLSLLTMTGCEGIRTPLGARGRSSGWFKSWSWRVKSACKRNCEDTSVSMSKDEKGDKIRAACLKRVLRLVKREISALAYMASPK